MKHLLLSLAALASMHAGLMHAQKQPQSPYSYNHSALPGNAGGLPYGHAHARLYNSSSATSPFTSPPMMLPAARPVAVATALHNVHAHAASEGMRYRRLHVQAKKDSPESQRNVQPMHSQKPFEEHVVYAHEGDEQEPSFMGHPIGAVVQYIPDPVNSKAGSAPASLVQAAHAQAAASAQRQAVQSTQAPQVPAPMTCCTIL